MRGQTMSVKKTNLEVCTHACTLRAHCTLHGNIIFDILEQSSFQKYTTCWVFLALCLMLYLCICVFLYLYFCICAFDTWEYHFWYTWTILFSKIYYMLGLSGTLSYAVFVYLCVCVFVFGLGRSLLDQFGQKKCQSAFFNFLIQATKTEICVKTVFSL